MEDNAELESFRRQWREEVAHRARPKQEPSQPSQKRRTSTARPSHFPPTRHGALECKEEEENAPVSFDQGEIVEGVGQLSLGVSDENSLQAQQPPGEPESALEHFERAVEKEAEGSLGDSLQLYRKAYRLDSAVDKAYRHKHFAWAWKKPAQKPVPNAAAVAASTTIQSGQQSQDEPVALPVSELIASFAHCPIPQAEPIIDGDPLPPCPIANAPTDVLVEILKQVAVMDPASLVRLSLVCKRFAYHFAHEQHIWKRLCQGAEFGFKAMHYTFACDIFGLPEYTLVSRYTPFPTDAPVQIPPPLSSWSDVFQMFPRIRFTGIYISTVNYTRPGAASSYQNVSWNSPIHIVTYYRYLRFYPDGSVISLLSTVEPLEVVPYISKENVLAARATTHKQHQRHASDTGTTLAGASDPIPPVAMGALKYANRGRWRLAKPFPPEEGEDEDDMATDSLPDAFSMPVKTDDDPRDVVIETEGVGPKYRYLLYLSLRSSSAGKANAVNPSPSNPSKNTKLVWKGYWSYNKLTDDWAEFGLRNDRAFAFRRVRGWDMA